MNINLKRQGFVVTRHALFPRCERKYNNLTYLLKFQTSSIKLFLFRLKHHSLRDVERDCPQIIADD